MTPEVTLPRLKALVTKLVSIPLVNRMLHSAWQGAALVLLADLTQLADLAIWNTAVAAAGMAALSALKTYLFSPPVVAPQ